MNKFKDIQKRLAKEKSLIYFDIETSPGTFYGWGLGEQYVNHNQMITPPKVISIQWMFEGDKKVSYLTWDKNQDDAKMLEQFSQIMMKVKVAISQNGINFDHKVLRWRLNVHNLTPLKNVEMIDVLKLSRKSFRAPSHKLDYRSNVYGFGGKIKMELKDWINVLNKVPGALEKMIKYGCKDVPDLRSIFWKELPYYHNIPFSLSTLVYPEKHEARVFCPICANKRQKKFDVFPTKVGNKQMLKCDNCGHIWKETRSISRGK